MIRVTAKIILFLATCAGSAQYQSFINEETAPYHQHIFGTCPVDALFCPTAFSQWAAQRMDELRSAFITPRQALQQMLKNQRKFIEEKGPNYHFLIHEETYTKHAENDWHALLLATFIIDHLHDDRPKDWHTLFNIQSPMIQAAFESQNLHHIFRDSALFYRLLKIIDIAESETALTLNALPAPKAQVTMIDWVLSAKHGSIIIPVAHDYTHCETWSTHGGYFQNIFSILARESIGHHLQSVITQGDIINSAFFNIIPNKSPFQILAENVFAHFHDTITPISTWDTIVNWFFPSTTQQTITETYTSIATRFVGAFHQLREAIAIIPGHAFHTSNVVSLLGGNPQYPHDILSTIMAIHGHTDVMRAQATLQQAINEYNTQERCCAHTLPSAEASWMATWQYPLHASKTAKQQYLKQHPIELFWQNMPTNTGDITTLMQTDPNRVHFVECSNRYAYTLLKITPIQATQGPHFLLITPRRHRHRHHTHLSNTHGHTA